MPQALGRRGHPAHPGTAAGGRGLHSRAPQAALSLAQGQEPGALAHPPEPPASSSSLQSANVPARGCEPVALGQPLPTRCSMRPRLPRWLAPWQDAEEQQARSRRSSWSSRSIRHPEGRGTARHGHCSPQPPRCPSPPRPSRNGDARGSRQRCSGDQARQGTAARSRQQTPHPSLHRSCSSPSTRPGGHRFTQTATCLQKDFIKLRKYTNHPNN